MKQSMKKISLNLEDQKRVALGVIMQITQPVITHDAHGNVKTVWSRVGVNAIASTLHIQRDEATRICDALAEDKLVIRLYRRKDHQLQVQLKG